MTSVLSALSWRFCLLVDIIGTLVHCIHTVAQLVALLLSSNRNPGLNLSLLSLCMEFASLCMS